jgi:hypothetical protein
VARLPGGGLGCALVGVVMSRHGGNLILRVSSASCVAEVVWHECIRLYSGDASQCHWVASCQFIGIVSSLS